MPSPKQQFFDNSGNPLVGGRLYTYAPGTTTHKTAWANSAGTVACTYVSDGAGGLYIALDARGEALIYWAGSYKVVLKSSTGSLIYTVDNFADGVNSIAQTAADNAATAATAAANAAMTASLATAAGSATASASSAAAALASLNDFKGRWYGALASDPTLDPLGAALTVGDAYFNSVSNLLKIYNGATWQASDINTADLAASSGAGLVGTIGSGIGAVARTQQSINRDMVSPFTFGAVGDGITDDAVALLKFAAHVGLYPVGNYELVGNFATSQPIVFNFTMSLYLPCTIKCGVKIKSIITTLSDVLTFNSGYFLAVPGSISVYCNGTIDFATRKNVRGIVFNDCSRFVAGSLKSFNAISHAVAITGVSSQYYIAEINADGGGCGYGTISRLATTISVLGAQTGGFGSASQRQVITVAVAPPSYVSAVDWWVKIGTTLHKITAISGADITLYPYVSSGDIVGATVSYIGGAGIFSQGGDTSCGQVGRLDSSSYGLGYYSLSLYPPSVDNYVSQSNSIVAGFGSGIGDAITTAHFGYLYNEVNEFGLVTTNGGGGLFGSIAILPSHIAIRFLWLHAKQIIRSTQVTKKSPDCQLPVRMELLIIRG
jgi:hypothetical protein